MKKKHAKKARKHGKELSAHQTKKVRGGAATAAAAALEYPAAESMVGDRYARSRSFKAL